MQRLLGLGAVCFLVVACLAACNAGATAAPTYALQGAAVAGPTCPVEPASPLPGQCAPRAVAGAVLVITNAAGQEVTRVKTDGSGAFTAAVPAGSYIITPQPVVGLMIVAPPVSVTIGPSGGPGSIALQYNTGIR